MCFHASRGAFILDAVCPTALSCLVHPGALRRCAYLHTKAPLLVVHREKAPRPRSKSPWSSRACVSPDIRTGYASTGRGAYLCQRWKLSLTSLQDFVHIPPDVKSIH